MPGFMLAKKSEMDFIADSPKSKFEGSSPRFDDVKATPGTFVATNNPAANINKSCILLTASNGGN